MLFFFYMETRMTTKTPKRAPRSRTETKTAVATVVAPAAGLPFLTEQRKLAADAIKAVEQIDLDTVLQNMSKSGLGVHKLLSEVHASITSSYQQAQAVREGLAAYRSELEDLYGKDVLLNNLRDVQAETEEKLAGLEIALTDAKSVHARQVLDLQEQFAQQKRDRVRERNEEEANFIFNRDQSRRREEENYRSQIKAIEQGLTARGEALTEQEEELASLRQQAAGFAERLEIESRKAASIAGSSVKKDLTHEFLLASKDLESKLALAAAENSNLRSQNATLQAQNSTLQGQVAGVTDRLTEISKSALESASGQRALDEVNKYATNASGASARK